MRYIAAKIQGAAMKTMLIKAGFILPAFHRRKDILSERIFSPAGLFPKDKMKTGLHHDC